jgi:polyisoprenyl-teichoic acid--peptidoglycan teichoic acid transferase
VAVAWCTSVTWFTCVLRTDDGFPAGGAVSVALMSLPGAVHPRHRPRGRFGSALALALSIGVGGSVILVSESRTEAGKVRTDLDVQEALQEADPGAEVENYLLVGSDSRANADPNSPDYGGIGGADTTEGQRSDTIMVLRHNRVTGEAGLLSLPRDLWVKISDTGKHNRINSAFGHGTDVLVNTITENLGIPIHHYVQVDFNGFKQLVDAIGGVNACFEYPTRDKNTGLSVGTPGCYELDGLTGLQYTRSRHYEEFKDAEWQEDGRGDLSRIDRQQKFIVAAVNKAVGRLGENPFVIDDLLRAAQDSVVVDPGLDLISVAKRFGDLVGKNLITLQVPVENEMIDGNAVLLLDEDEAQPVLDYFRGIEPTVATTAATATTAG